MFDFFKYVADLSFEETTAIAIFMVISGVVIIILLSMWLNKQDSFIVNLISWLRGDNQ